MMKATIIASESFSLVYIFLGNWDVAFLEIASLIQLTLVRPWHMKAPLEGIFRYNSGLLGYH